MATCHLSKPQTRALVQEFTELHEGLPPDKISCEKYRGPALPVVPEGRVVQIDYDKLVPYGKQWYYHPIKVESQPVIGFDRNKLPVVYGGRIHVTTHGIEDIDSSRDTREFIPSRPQSLTVFGRLRQIRYKPRSASRIETWKPSRFLALAHDEQGTLHIIPERIHEGKHMARRRSSRKGARRNPTASALSTAGQVAFVGLGAAAVAGIADHFLAPQFQGYKLAAAEIGSGLVLGIAAKAMGAKPAIVGSLGVGPVVVGGLRAYEEYQRQATLGVPANTGTGTGSSTAPGAKPGAYVLMPGGMPQGYYPVTRQTCAVR